MAEVTASFLGKGFKRRSLHFLWIGTLALGEASCHVKSPTTLSLPCYGKAPDICLERFYGEREMPINHLLKTCKWEAFSRLQLHWEANTSETMKDNKKGYFEPLNFGVVNYLALDNQNRETFYPSLSEERGYFWVSRIVYVYFCSQMLGP